MDPVHCPKDLVRESSACTLLAIFDVTTAVSSAVSLTFGDSEAKASA